MFTTHASIATLVLALQAASPVSAQNYTEKVWGVVAYTLYGDSTPVALVQDSSRVLTNYGASSLAAAGSAFRDRYVATEESGNEATGIQDISTNLLDTKQIEVFSTTDQYVAASAQAFLQGLYPPLGQSNITYADWTTELANGSLARSPLDGYQYPRIVTLGSSDPQSLTLAGQTRCPMHNAAKSEYLNSDNVQEFSQEMRPFYAWIWGEALAGVYAESSATYSNAVDIANYLEYELVHNSSLLKHVNHDEISRVRWLADRYTYDTNSQDSSFSQSSYIGAVNAIAGQTLASSILHALDTNVNGNGAQSKMTLLFGSDEPAVALASLVGLADQQQSNFYSRPARGGSLIFELYSFGDSEQDSAYPSPDDLYVRFFLHNGTNSSIEFLSYSLFKHGPSQAYIPYTEFRTEMETFATTSIQEWCLRCNSQSVFCEGAVDRNQSPSEGKKQVSPAVAGVIGAVVTLVVVAMLAAICFLIWGVHKHTHKPSLGGFKGTRKLASDKDVTFRNPVWGIFKPLKSQQPDEAPADAIVQGHERVGSWEMGQQQKEIEDISTGNPQGISPFDENEEEWRAHSGLQPVKVRESV
ncbi:hypothetical protein NUU61_007833 [Penicillium alfredii]|uniref:Histidine phosphatase superfamily n=1 Tax=Penicillium alfredii TaxID=1506179 RepID=A0A9W9ERC6_9EURO|nr:uncharacterized protein NUU61_007833 [Penicillium alfredii]KAJ5086526.1 hypothetical protein NUU61_007833 [Penicillium alfredii]